MAEVAVEGWRPVEDIVRWGFGQVPVVMANEFYSGWARSVRTRVIGARMIRAAHEVGVRRLAMEALELGWTLWAYEHQFESASRKDPAHLLSMEFTNWRERQQAANLCRLLDFSGRPPGHAQELLEFLADALVISTDNELTGTLPAESGPTEDGA